MGGWGGGVSVCGVRGGGVSVCMYACGCVHACARMCVRAFMLSHIFI